MKIARYWSPIKGAYVIFLNKVERGFTVIDNRKIQHFADYIDAWKHYKKAIENEAGS